ncbi:hypothetical protein K490DRAFT_56607 [Saccharata proteae CBS 121410]|uniref:Uncharacterized protein n=1 Tax=Saccharata proteae CBS 121410 TaxID=1314787 RepID=A0A9P4HY62_9PEZI|nr:hypothetical protein K490DRAFT_56607 [Saccharata proteae CBS 121410]
MTFQTARSEVQAELEAQEMFGPDPLNCRDRLILMDEAPNLHGWGFVAYVTVKPNSDKPYFDYATTKTPTEASDSTEIAIERLKEWVDQLLRERRTVGLSGEKLKEYLEWTVVHLPDATKQDVRDAFKAHKKDIEIGHPDDPTHFEIHDRMCLMVDDDSVASILKHDSNDILCPDRIWDSDSFVTVIDPSFDQPVVVASRARGTPRGQPTPPFPIPGALYYLGYKKSKISELVPLFWDLANDSWVHEEVLQSMQHRNLEKMDSDFSCTASTERILEKGYP